MYNNNEQETKQRTDIVSRRGDSFDIGQHDSQAMVPHDQVIRILQNPGQLAGLLNLTEEQAENIKGLITGAGAGLSSKYLANTFGDEIAGMIGGFIGGYVSRRVLGKKKRKL